MKKRMFLHVYYGSLRALLSVGNLCIRNRESVCLLFLWVIETNLIGRADQGSCQYDIRLNLIG